MSRKVLITGVTGALGKALKSHLLANLSDWIIFAPERGQQSDSLDLRHHDQIMRTIERIRPDLIMHLAATFSNDFDKAYAVNVTAVRDMLSVIEDFGLSTRVVLIGSAAEYGLVSAEENPIGEDHVLRPVSIYGMTKAWQTELAYLYAGRSVDVVVARIFNLVGNGLSEQLFVGRLHKQISELRRGERVRIEVGPLSAVRDYITMDNAVTQLLAIADFGETGKIYHVASGQPVTMRELLIRELATYGLDDSIVVEGIGLTNRRGYDVPMIYADITKTNLLLKKWENDTEC
uniref:Nucleoside-diphosphate-sugar epimerase n=1 Tax=Candidatus Kentrum sp. SD TaxID=2126332 RepID=A0A451BMR9_9GAMM|nr:MAG: Nucleoside-diphosphate-sugar epimerase [Candidatus Kentron sp. SD]